MRNPFVGIERALYLTLFFAAFAAAGAGFGARAIDRLAANYETDRSAYAVVRVIAPEGPEGVAAAQTALAHAPHVMSAAPMTAERAAELLASWGGAPIAAADMPDLRLIEIEFAPAEPGVDRAGNVNARLAELGVTAEIVRAPPSATSARMAGLVRNVALWGAFGFGGVMALLASLSARGLAARRRDYIAVLADLGATRSQTAGRIADEAALVGLYAGVAGTALAAVLAAIVLMVLLPQTTIDTLPDYVRAIDLAPLLATPIGAALATGFGARAAAGDFHATAARLD